MVESVLILPLLILLALLLFAGAQRTSVQQLVQSSSRDAARFAAELGDGAYASASGPAGCQVTVVDPCALDAQIVGTAMSTLSGVSGLTVDEITISQPDWCSPDSVNPGSCPPSETGAPLGKPKDRYRPDGSLINGPQPAQFTLDDRVQAPPSEHFVTVAITYTYQSGSPVNLFDGTFTVYSTFQFAPGP